MMGFGSGRGGISGPAEFEDLRISESKNFRSSGFQDFRI
jgi:hypothetical protein